MKSNRIVLRFVVGDRLLRCLSTFSKREAEMTKLLKGGPQDHATLVKSAMQKLVTAERTAAGALKELALLRAKDINENSANMNFVLLHQKNAGKDFLNLLAAAIEDKVSILVYKNTNLFNKALFLDNFVSFRVFIINYLIHK